MELRIELDISTPYSPGETVRGRVLLVKTGNQNLLAKCTGVKIQFEGRANVKYTLNDSNGNNADDSAWSWNPLPYWGRSSGGWKTQESSQYYFHVAYYLIGGEGTHSTQEDIDLLNDPSSSLLEFPFTYQLPGLVPCSFKGTHGSVEYIVRAILERRGAPSEEIVKEFEVQSDLDVALLNHRFQTRRGNFSAVKKSGRVGRLWWSGTVYLHLRLRKKAYVPGEFVRFAAQIINDSKCSLQKAKILLTQEVRYLAQGTSYSVSHILKKIKGPAMKSGERTIVWEDPEALKVPPLTPTNLGDNTGTLCSLIEINYFIVLMVQSSSTLSIWNEKPVICKVPILIGTKKGAGGRDSWCFGDNFSLPMMSPWSTLDGRSSMIGLPHAHLQSPSPSEWSHYQNTVFPMHRTFSSPIYENHRFSRTHMVSSPLSFAEELEEQDQKGNGDIPPPSYEEAMESYQNAMMMMMSSMNSRALPATPRESSSSPSTVIEEPLYHNAD